MIMIRFPLLLLAMLLTLSAVSQKHCDTPEDPIADPNSITKCAVKEIKDADGNSKKQVSIEVSTRKRVIRKNKAVVAIESAGTPRQIANVKKTTLLIGKLELEDTGTMLEKIPFNLVEEIPLFEKCESKPLIEQAKCFDQQMSKHILKHFAYPEEALNKRIEGRVLTQFTINNLGKIEDIRLRGPEGGELLEEEAKRLVKKLPTFIPGKHNGKIVKVKYGIPITFRLPGSSKFKKNHKKYTKKTKTSVPVNNEETIKDFVKFNKAQSIPIFKACKGASEKLDCFNDRMISHIQRNFHYPEEAAKDHIQGKVWVTFIIDTEGKIKDIITRAPKDGHLLELEARRMVSNLPTFIPGKHNGKIVNVQYSIPINFKLN